MKETFSKWDAADFLDNEEDIRLYLEETRAISNSPKTIAHALAAAERARQRWQHQNTPGVMNGV